jgi:hydrophobic/amphiphilic exporter-1 (mainly G- bacteria), HAE1 family
MISWFAHRPAVAWAISGALLLAGAVSFARLPLATRPQVELPRLQVSASWPGASPELIETYLTSPIEEAIQGVRGVKKVSSTSSDGQSSLQVELEAHTDVTLTRLAILERMELLRKEFPAGASSPYVGNYVPEDLEEAPLLTYVLSGPFTPGTLQDLIEKEIEPRILSVPGVAGVDNSGGAERRVSVTYDASRLRQLNINPDRLREALANARAVRPLGLERFGASERAVLLSDAPQVVEDLEELPVRGAGSLVHRLGDLASVRLDEDTQDRFNRLNGKPAVTINIARLPGADAIKTAAHVREVVAGLTDRLPPGVTFYLSEDSSLELSEQLNDLLLRGTIAFFAVLGVLLVALRKWRGVALVMGSAALAIAGTALGLFLLDIPVNFLTLAGLGMGIGILVQDGVVVVDRLRLVGDTPAERAAAGARILPAVLGSTLTTIVVLIPFLYLQGDTRAAFLPFAVAFGLALSFAVLTSVVLIPALAHGHDIHRARYPRLDRFYGKSVIFLLRWRYPALLCFAAALGFLFWRFATKVPRVSFGWWGGQSTFVFVGIGFPRGSEPGATDRAIREFEAIAVGAPGVDRVVTNGARDFASMRVIYTKEAANGPLPYQMQDALTERGVFVGGAEIRVTGQGPGFSAGYGGGGFQSYRIKVLGYSYTGVEALAKDLQARLMNIPRVRSVDINAGAFRWGGSKAFSVALSPDRAELARSGITAQQFASTVAREIRGSVGQQTITFGDVELRVDLKSAGARDRSLDDLRGTLMPNDRRQPVRIGDLSTVSEREGLSLIQREDQQYVRIVSYDFRGPQKLAQRTHEAFMNSISVPAGYTVADDGFEWQQDESRKGLWLVFGIGVLLVILAVALVFDSIWATAQVMLSLPVALAGVAAAFLVAKASFSREAAVGVILVVGLAVHQGILLVHGALLRKRANAPLPRQGEGSGERASLVSGTTITGAALSPRPPLPVGRGGALTAMQIVGAARDRSGMIVLITATTMASLIPLAVGDATDTLFGSIALATAGGTIFGTIGTMWVLPLMLMPLRKPRFRWNWLWKIGGMLRRVWGLVRRKK